MQPSFREILEKKLKSPLEEPVSPKGKSQFSDPFALSFLMGSIPQFKYQNKAYDQHSSTQEQPSKSEPTVDSSIVHSIESTAEELTVKESTHSLNDLTAVGVTAFYVLKSLGADLSESFTFSELKKQYRRLLLRYHPDHCCETDIEPFYDLMQAYESLVSELGDI